MSTEALQTLDFDDVLALIAGYVGSPLGRARVLSLAPLRKAETIQARLQLAAEAREYARTGSEAPEHPQVAKSSERSTGRLLQVGFGGFDDPGPAISHLSVEGTTLDLSEISLLLRFADCALDVRQTLLAARSRFPGLAAAAEMIGDFNPLLRELKGKILPSGDLDEHASPELQRIRREIEKQRGQIFSLLRRFLRAETEESPQQEEIITIRSERFVIPVRAQRKAAVPGVVHGSSSSGQTVYVEPLESIELNNELVRLHEEEAREIHRILQRMTSLLRERAPELLAAGEAIGTLDLAFACARYALDYDCAIPRFNTNSARILLKDARHPLLDALLRSKRATAVPFSFTLETDRRVLVLSGPNTGGKTVVLKTVGLLALMALVGLPVPAAEAEFPFFDRILADIGDSQSIQESLSTFSAHLLNIRSMIEAAGPDSLILLDELGTATDPEEAGALAVAVVDRFRSAGAFTLASTHHMALKAYALQSTGVASGNMGFDERTLQPTYRLEVGWPGQSSGLAIAERLGLPADVLQRAREAISAAHHELERLLARLREEETALTRLRTTLEEQEAALRRREKEWLETIHRRESQRAAEWERQLDSLWHGFEQRAEEKLREISARSAKPGRGPESAREAARIASRLREEGREELRHSLLAQLGSAPEARPDDAEPAVKREPVLGDNVQLKGFGQSGVVRAIIGESLEVEVGRLRMRVPREDVSVNAAAGTESARPRETYRVQRESAADRSPGQSPSEINVIGETADEARRRVDKFLDNAFLSQLSRVRIVHGSGKGILRQALAEMFADHPHVEKFFPAPQNEGGAGATIVELKV